MGALQIPTLSDLQVVRMVNALASHRSTLEKRVILATCDEGLDLMTTHTRSGRFSNPGYVMLRAPCVAALSFAHLLLLAAAGISIVSLCPNPSCSRAKGLTYVEEAFKLMNAMVDRLGLSSVLMAFVRETPDMFVNSLPRLYEKIPNFTRHNNVPIGGRMDMVRSATRQPVSLASRGTADAFEGASSHFFDVAVDDSRCTLSAPHAP